MLEQTAIGEGVKDYKVGDRVAVEAGQYCGSCRLCKLGRYNLCTKSASRLFPCPGSALTQHSLLFFAFTSALRFLCEGLPPPGWYPPVPHQPPRRVPPQASGYLLLRAGVAR